MTEETKQQFDAIIDALHLEPRTGLSKKDIIKKVETMAVLMDLCTVMADVIDSMLLDVEDIITRIKVPVDDRRNTSYFKELKKLVGAARKWAQRATRETYNSERTDDLATESDWWKAFILMVEDRTGTDELKTLQLIRWISTMPSQLHLFENISTKDFKRMIQP